MVKDYLKSFTGFLFAVVLLLVLPINRISAQEKEVVLNRVSVNNDSVLFDSSIDKSSLDLVVLSHKQNNLLFYVDREPDLYYSFFMEGYDRDWSMWSPYPVKEYTNLGSGMYQLRIRTGNQGIIMSEDLIYSFQVKAPLVLSPFFLGLYAVLLGLVIWAIYRLLLSRHIRKQIALEQLVQSRTEELNDIKERTESLLANVLPKGTAAEIMAKGKATKKKFNFATVLFSDIQGFTRIAEETNPEVLIDELDRFFFYFDSVVEKYNIEKIKTIGDAYMCAGGIPKRNRTNPIEVIQAAIEMQSFMEELKKEREEKGQIFWDLRIGLHTGMVIAGVVGHKKLSYDIWGDTVNIASRMESSGEAGKINISGTTYDYVKEFFICEFRGKMPVKYKGELDMYFVNGIRPELRLEGRNEPNALFENKILMIRLLDLEEEVFETYEDKGSKDLTFHDIRYLKNITTQAELIGRAELLEDEKMLLLRLASIFVMSGYLSEYKKFISESLVLLKSKSIDYGFNETHISETATIISDALSHEPESQCGQILHDSIYDYLGREDYLTRVELLFSEEEKFLGISDKRQWLLKQAGQLSSHNFRTGTAKLLRSNSPEKQLEVLIDYSEKF